MEAKLYAGLDFDAAPLLSLLLLVAADAAHVVHVQGPPGLAVLEHLKAVDLLLSCGAAPLGGAGLRRDSLLARAGVEEIGEVEPLLCAVVPFEVVVDIGQPARLRVKQADQLSVAVDVRPRYPVEGEERCDEIVEDAVREHVAAQVPVALQEGARRNRITRHVLLESDALVGRVEYM